jgi:hypothetical protein
MQALSQLSYDPDDGGTRRLLRADLSVLHAARALYASELWSQTLKMIVAGVDVEPGSFETGRDLNPHSSPWGGFIRLSYRAAVRFSKSSSARAGRVPASMDQHPARPIRRGTAGD